MEGPNIQTENVGFPSLCWQLVEVLRAVFRKDVPTLCVGEILSRKEGNIAR